MSTKSGSASTGRASTECGFVFKHGVTGIIATKRKTTEPAAEKFPPRWTFSTGRTLIGLLDPRPGMNKLKHGRQVGRRVSIFSLYCTYVYFTAHWRGVRGDGHFGSGWGWISAFPVPSISIFFL